MISVKKNKGARVMCNLFYTHTYSLGSFDSVAGHLVNLKIIFEFKLQEIIIYFFILIVI